MPVDQALRLATEFHRAGKLAEAESLYRRALASDPTSHEAHNDLGNVLCDAGRCEEAVGAYRAALALNPRYLPAHNNLGTALRDLGCWAEAVDAYSAALGIDPRVPDVHNNLGVVLADQGFLDEAVESYRKATELSPSYAEAFTNLGVSLYARGEAEGAVAACERAVALNPTFAKAHSNLAMILLGTGDFARGWAEHEWRWKGNPAFKPRAFAQPMWDGRSLDGRTILLHAEQGFGDTIQFVRFAPLVAQRGGRVVVECQGELVSLIGDSTKEARVVGRGEPLPEFEVHCPLMSLPWVLGIREHSIPNSPYLNPRPHTIERWKSKLGSDPRVRVGIVWAGRGTHTNDRNRSMPPSKLERLTSVRGITLHSLQRGAAFGNVPEGVIDHSDELTDFADTAGLIANLDLVISVDTAVAHLAGAMGTPVWLMLPYSAEWRWMLKRSDSPWYPSMRLFRQPRWGDWDGVVEAVAEALSTFVSRDRPSASTIRSE